MAKIIRRLPFVSHQEEHSVPGSKLILLPNQIIVWVTILEPGLIFDANAPRLPAVLDTGTNHNFVLREKHLNCWANYELGSLAQAGSVFFRGQELATYDADIWLYQNMPGQREPRFDVHPFRLELDKGMIVTTKGADAPALPALGMRALQRAGLRLLIDCGRRLVSIRSPG
jgi:hypothetical protein